MPKDSAKEMAPATATKILKGFEKHYRVFQKIARQSKHNFELCHWQQLQTDAKNRIYFYDKQVKACIKTLGEKLAEGLFDRVLWENIKHHYTHLISTHKQPELAETFYNSIFCNLFDKRYYNNNFIFVKPSISTSYIDMDEPVTKSYYMTTDKIKSGFASILKNCRFKRHYQNFARDVARLEQQLKKQLPCDKPFEIQMLLPLFLRGKAAYLIGKAVMQNEVYPLLVAVLNHPKEGLYVDALLTNNQDISLVFSFSRSYFMVDTPFPSAVIEFLKTILHNKTTADLYSAIGLHKHGKTLLYRMFLKYIKISDEKLVTAPGIKGMVMTVFTFPMYPYVFKVINDDFPPPKTGDKESVKKKYRFVKNHYKAGRLADTWEFSNVAFPIDKLDDDLLKELNDKLISNIEIDNNLLIIKHLYIENKMTPLNLYLKEANKEQTMAIVNDYGRAIDELVNAGIFPGDMLIKNFGVTRQNRVVFYDYDEIMSMDKPNFRAIPKPRFIEDELASEPPYHVDENDVFPEEFEFFMFNDEAIKTAFNQRYKKLLDANYWRSIQDKIKQGYSRDYYPYPDSSRMINV